MSAVAVLGLSTFLALGGVVASPGKVSAQSNVAQFCQEILPLVNQFLSVFLGFEVEVSQGGCVSAFQAGNLTAAAASLCHSEELVDLIDAGNHGKCTQAVKAFLENLLD